MDIQCIFKSIRISHWEVLKMQWSTALTIGSVVEGWAQHWLLLFCSAVLKKEANAAAVTLENNQLVFQAMSKPLNIIMIFFFFFTSALQNFLLGSVQLQECILQISSISDLMPAHEIYFVTLKTPLRISNTHRQQSTILIIVIR